MALYSYSRTKPKFSINIGKIISSLLIVSGLSILTMVIYPIVTFELYYKDKFTDLTSPVPVEDNKLSNKLTRVLGGSFNDFTRASLWFPGVSPISKSVQNLNSYTLSIPKLKIENANVIVGGEDLTKSLIQFTGSLPGSIGNPVIFGHSTLLFFYSPTDYKAIFSKLPELDEGDEVLVTSDNVSYRYRVFQMYITGPKDFKVLDQNQNEEQITLVTCVPPGTFLKRFIVKGRLEKFQ